MASTLPQPPEGTDGIHHRSDASRATRATQVPPAPEAAPRAVPEAAPEAAPGAGRVETHGIDHIPDAERHGHPRQLFSVWAAVNVNYLSLVMGGALILMGLSLAQALCVIVVGNLLWLPVGLLAVSGPASGTPSEVIMRAMYGVHGNRVNIAITGWLLCVCYFALNMAAAALAAFSLAHRVGITPNTAVKTVIVVVLAAVTLAISVYGHATIMRLYLPITAVLTVAFVVVGAAVLHHADLGFTHAEPLTGNKLWIALAGGATLIASGPLSYTNGADFSRYLPRSTSAKAVMGWTALGGFLPAVVVCSLGALAATAVDMSDLDGLEGILPSWFAPLFLLALVLGAIALNAMTAYSSGLALQAVGIRLRRSVSVLFDGVLATALTLYALLVSNFLDTVSNILQLTVVLLGPSTAVYAVDILLRRNRYDGKGLNDDTATSPYWYDGGVNWTGTLALAAGCVASALCVNTLYSGPLAALFGGADLSLPVGILVAGGLYHAAARRRITA